MSKQKFKTGHDRKRQYAIYDDEMITEQAHDRSCDLTYILRQYTQYGQLPIGNTRGEAMYMDCPDQDYDYKYMQDTIKRAESEFYKLPLEEQVEHDNNPAEWLRGVLSDEFIHTPEDTEPSGDGSEASSEASQTDSEEANVS